MPPAVTRVVIAQQWVVVGRLFERLGRPHVPAAPLPIELPAYILAEAAMVERKGARLALTLLDDYRLQVLVQALQNCFVRLMCEAREQPEIERRIRDCERS